jgi:hypothetical protein
MPVLAVPDRESTRGRGLQRHSPAITISMIFEKMSTTILTVLSYVFDFTIFIGKNFLKIMCLTGGARIKRDSGEVVL